MFKSIFSLIVAGSAIGLFFGWTLPNFEGTSADRQKKAGLEAAIVESGELQKKRDDLLNNYYNKISAADREKLNKALPLKVSAINLVTQINDMARNKNLVLRSINIEEPKAAGSASAAMETRSQPFKTAIIVFKVSGPYSVFLSFLEDIEKSLQIIDINDLNFSASEKGDYDFNVRATTYYAGE